MLFYIVSVSTLALLVVSPHKFSNTHVDAYLFLILEMLSTHHSMLLILDP